MSKTRKNGDLDENLMDEFQVSEYLSLKLENRKTNIFVVGELFRRCKFLLVKISVEEMKSFNEIESIDKAAEKLDKTLEIETSQIDRVIEFWRHYSNIQVWSENDYNTKLLHRNLAFSLLKRLNEVGDPVAKKV